jgi:hypothetical protein
MATKHPSYRRRLVVFLRFVDCDEIVDQIAAEPDRLTSIIHAIDQIRESATSGPHFGLTQMSDSVVISYIIDREPGVAWMIDRVQETIKGLIWRGIAVRGAVTVGDVIHTDRYLVGPAMVAASRMESEQVSYPRVIVDPAVLEILRRSQIGVDMDDPWLRHRKRQLVQDADGQFYCDYVSMHAVVTPDSKYSDYPEHLQHIVEILKRGLEHEDARVCEKYLWLHKKYLQAIAFLEDLPEGHPYRQNNFINYGKIESLPRFEELARAVQARVLAARGG